MDTDFIQLAKDNGYKIDLTKYVPDFIYSDPITGQVLDIQGYMLGALAYYIADILANTFIETATWGLDIMEQEYGIQTDYSLSYSSRKQTLLAHKKGYGATTEAMIKSIAEVYDCDCEVIPHYDEYYFIIKFIGIGIPSNLNAFKEIIEQFKPAHLGVEYQFTYETWGEVKNFTWWDVGHYTWEQILTEPLKHYDDMPKITGSSVVGRAIVGTAIVGKGSNDDMTNGLTGSALIGQAIVGNEGTK